MVKVVTLVVVDCYIWRNLRVQSYVHFSVVVRIHDILKDHHHDVHQTYWIEQLWCSAYMLCSLVNFFTPALANIGNFELYFLNFCVLIVKKNLQFKEPFLNIDSHCVMHCVVHRCSAYMWVGVVMAFCQLSFFSNTVLQSVYVLSKIWFFF